MRAQVLSLPFLAILLAGCVSNRMDDDGTILTTAEANRSGVGGALTAPLRDVNVIQTKIPPILLEAYAEAYTRPADGCAGLAAEVGRLDEVLGPDLDTPEEREKARNFSRERAEDAALGWVAGAASDVIPFRGWVRKLTGAERHDRLVAESIAAGRVRRGYLKGLGEARGCNPPATPEHLPEPPEPPKQGLQPNFPIN